MVDAPKPTPTVIDTTGLAGLSDRDLLIVVLNKLNSLEARIDRESKFAQVALDSLRKEATGVSLASLANGGSVPTPAAAITKQGSWNFAVQGSLCVQQEFAADAKMESSLSLWGGAEGMLGVDAYGNGAKGEVRGFATADTKIIPGGGAKVSLQLCGQITPSLNLTTARLASSIASAPATSGSGGAAEQLLQTLVQSVSLDQLAAGASRLGMDGTRVGPALNALSSFSLADLPFGRGGGAALINALPLPTDVANVLHNPTLVLQGAADAAQFAVDKVCNQTLFNGDFAQRALQACNLRNQVPDGQSLIGILQGLDGLPTTLGALRSDLTSACGTVNAMLPARVSVPPWDVTFPLGIGTVRTFPGISRDIFPGLAHAC